ncbi:hypothetical protein RRG08_024001 [Elysia crispata]|uniref:F-BAR domain-containing protein n=1 Tax=Elysia crispata TaxID=231223 RepID=A0AAE1D1F3_9GAST|nr:hypothetical protein RRG08_024001 [Elysia crispata]
MLSTKSDRRKSRIINIGRESLVMTLTTYADTFWGGDLSCLDGFKALSRRNHEGKKICGEVEEYLKKRCKLETDYSKSLSGLAKIFKEQEQIGVLEATIIKLRSELDAMASAHTRAADFFNSQADLVEKFKKDQSVNKKAVEDTLSKAQNAKISQLSKTKQLEKTYVRRCQEKDSAEASLREIYTSSTAQAKEIDKARIKATKAEEEANKADDAYKSAVLVLEDSRVNWEREMVAACNVFQKLDEERITFLRQELWRAFNADSQIALDIDNSCEEVREILEKCDVVSDIDAFIQARGTGVDHPEPFQYRHYSKIVPSSDNDSGGSSEGQYTNAPYSEYSNEDFELPNSKPSNSKKPFSFPISISRKK